MSYITLEQLIERFGLTEISQLLQDEQDIVTDELLSNILNGEASSYSEQEVKATESAIARAETIIQRISDFMDSKFRARYTLPLQNPEQGNVVECCLALSRAALADDQTQVSKKVIAERDHWREWLKDVSNGKALLHEDRVGKIKGEEKTYPTRRPKSRVNWANY